MRSALPPTRHTQTDGDIRFTSTVSTQYDSATAAARAIPPGNTVVDLGACHGAVAVYCAKRWGAEVVAVEPGLGNLELLAHNLLENDVDATVLGVAVACAAGYVPLGGTPPIHSFHASTRWSGRPPHCLAVTPADLLPLLPEHIHFLKVDIEGAEHDVLNPETPGTAELLQRTRHAYIEVHEIGNHTRQREWERHLADLGFERGRLIGQGHLWRRRT